MLNFPKLVKEKLKTQIQKVFKNSKKNTIDTVEIFKYLTSSKEYTYHAFINERKDNFTKRK